jgi:hypothetical protein
MAYRIFRDSQGTEWQVYDVVPQLGDRRVSERRTGAANAPNTDRRSRTDRRVRDVPRSVLTAGLDTGWLCFETADVKRRLGPIPADWLHCDVAQLEQYCVHAKPARLMTPVFDMNKIDEQRS